MEFEPLDGERLSVTYVEREYNSFFVNPVEEISTGDSLKVDVEARQGYLITKVEVNGQEWEWDGWDGEPVPKATFTIPDAESDMLVEAYTVPKSNVYPRPYSYDITMRPGGTVNVSVVAWNNNPDMPVRVKLDGVTMLSDKNQEAFYKVLSGETEWAAPRNVGERDAILFPLFSMKPLDASQFNVKVGATQFSSGGTVFLSMTFIVMENPGAAMLGIPERVIVQTCTVAVSITGSSFEGESYGKFLGLFALPFGGPSFAAVATAAVWFGILIPMAWFAGRRVMAGGPGRGRLAISWGRYLAIAFLAVAVFGIALPLFIAGGSNRFLDYVKRTFNASMATLFFAAVFTAFSDFTRRYVSTGHAEDDSYAPSPGC